MPRPVRDLLIRRQIDLDEGETSFGFGSNVKNGCAHKEFIIG